MVKNFPAMEKDMSLWIMSMHNTEQNKENKTSETGEFPPNQEN